MEVSYHATGQYPDWWEGKRFTKPVKMWAASETTEATRDILQVTLLGGVFEEQFGTGTIPKDTLGTITKRQGVAGALDTILVKHVSGGFSSIGFKSYDQGREKFQGTAMDFIHLDEEPPHDIYTECVTRTMSTKGQIILTMTPLSGMTETCEFFLHSTDKSVQYFTAGWDDVPFYSEEDKQQMEAQYPPHEVDARRRGIPTVGRGKIYPFKKESISCEPFKIPASWRLCNGLDVGWNNTAMVCGAYDDNTDTWYIYNDYKKGELDPTQHTSNFRTLGVHTVPFVCDPAASSRSQLDGGQILETYRESPNDLNIEKADNAVDSGLEAVYERLRTGRLKIFSTCEMWYKEQATYARGKDQKPVKHNDHIMDATRYLIASGLEHATSELKRRKGREALTSMRQELDWTTI